MIVSLVVVVSADVDVAACFATVSHATHALTQHYPLPPSLTGKTNHHPGNIKWRLIIEEKKDEYMASPTTGRPIIAMEVVRIWRDLSPSRRFLRKDEETGL
jgi:hypothetical protein